MKNVATLTLLTFLTVFNFFVIHGASTEEIYKKYLDDRIIQVINSWPNDFPSLPPAFIPIISGFAADACTLEEFEKNSIELISAASENNIYRIKQLLEIGVDINKKEDKTGWTALIYAARNGNKAIVQLLIENQADLNIVDNVGNTALMRAIYRSYDEIAELLIVKGADLNIINDGNWTALSLAEYYNRSEIIKLINTIQIKA